MSVCVRIDLERLLAVPVPGNESERVAVALERSRCAEICKRVAQRWPDAPLMRACLLSLAEEIEEDEPCP